MIKLSKSIPKSFIRMLDTKPLSTSSNDFIDLTRHSFSNDANNSNVNDNNDCHSYSNSNIHDDYRFKALRTSNTNKTGNSHDYRFKALQSDNKANLTVFSYTNPIDQNQNTLKIPMIAYTKSEDEANDLIQTLKGPISLDMEWKVEFKKNKKAGRTALMQVSVLK